MAESKPSVASTNPGPTEDELREAERERRIQDALAEVERRLRYLRFGSVEVLVHQGYPEEIREHSKWRFGPSRSRQGLKQGETP